MKCHLYLGFNNYYNRKIKYYNTLEGYQDKLLVTIDNVNFKPNDGINTLQKVVMTQIADREYFNIKQVPDYAVVAEDDGTIVSRWFILQWDDKGSSVYFAKLRRDVIADNFKKIIKAPVFLEKATITDKTDVAIYNNEGMAFNQIKKSETPLKDGSLIPWIIGYVPTNALLDEHGDPIEITIEYDTEKYTFTPLQTASFFSDIPNVTNMPFKMFCIPYADITCYTTNPDTGTVSGSFTINKDLGLAIATGISAAVGSGNVFDIQMLPFCPLRNGAPNYTLQFQPDPEDSDLFPDTHGMYHVSSLPYFLLIWKEGDIALNKAKQILCWSDQNKFSFDISYSIPVPDNALDMKVKNETEMYRLCSPNFNGQFEFNPMKNNGVTKFNVDCMYQPYTPYIHINPDFGGLYGEDYDDARGLICGGDFSLPQETNAWANYIQNNKNYQSVFDRQIQNMEVNNKLAMEQAGVNAITGLFSGVAGSAIAGSMIGGPVGAIGGAIIGGVASAAGGIADIMMLDKQQKEALDYTRDLFNFNNQNIKAMPNGMSKTNPLVNNNKIFPIIEKYACSDTEVQALKNKLKYNGMTIGRIGIIKDWLLDDYSYIKCQLIELEDAEDYHTLVEIAAELNKGIRAKKEEA